MFVEFNNQTYTQFICGFLADDMMDQSEVARRALLRARSDHVRSLQRNHHQCFGKGVNDL